MRWKFRRSVRYQDLDAAAGSRSRDGLLSRWTARESDPRLTGWRSGILMGALFATVVLIVNICILIWAATRPLITEGFNNDYSDDSGVPPIIADGRRNLYQGNCATSRQLSVGLHLLINIMSTILLSACNYAMQCLSAPTRAEIDQAHAQGRWVDIGVFSIRNLRWVGRKRVIAWVLLGLSSVPLHLFYNSMVYPSVYAQDYMVYSATEDQINSNTTNFATYGFDAMHMQYMATQGLLDRLDNQDCITAYATEYPTSRGSVILVVESNTTNVPTPLDEEVIGSTFGATSDGCIPTPFQWICTGTEFYPCLGNKTNPPCTESVSKVNATAWAPLGAQVLYCLSEAFPPQCTLEFVPQIAGIVIALNFLKVSILVSIFLFLKDKPLTTIGDAISSFLQTPDRTVRDFPSEYRMVDHCAPQKHVQGIYRYSGIGSRRRWFLCLALYAVAICTCFGLFIWGLVGHAASASMLLSIALGASDPRTFITWALPSAGLQGFISDSLVANSPQVVLSLIYTTLNGLFTCFMLGKEWDDFGQRRKGLRISGVPFGAQRSTHFLQLPYRVAIPLIILSGLLHWLCSQSIFFVSIQLDAINFNLPYAGEAQSIGEFMTCAYSPRAILGVIILGLLMVATLLALGRRRYRGVIPVVGSCSAAISAYCHPDPKEKSEDLTIQRLQWGVTSTSVERVEGKAVARCAFSGQEVQPPIEGQWYTCTDAEEPWDEPERGSTAYNPGDTYMLRSLSSRKVSF